MRSTGKKCDYLSIIQYFRWISLPHWKSNFQKKRNLSLSTEPAYKIFSLFPSHFSVSPVEERLPELQPYYYMNCGRADIWLVFYPHLKQNPPQSFQNTISNYFNLSQHSWFYILNPKDSNSLLNWHIGLLLFHYFYHLREQGYINFKSALELIV